MTITVQVTYDVTTPESAEHGDHADHGFWAPGGWQFSIADDEFHELCERVGRDQALKDMTPEPETFDNVDDAVDFIASYGPFESSCSLPPCANGHCWVTQVDPNMDYATGADTRLSFHVDAPVELHNAIIEALVS